MTFRSGGRASAWSRIIAMIAFAIFGVWSAAASADVVSLQDALRRARDADPALTSAAARIEAAQAGVRQAEQRLNPALSLMAENFAGSGAASGFDNTETTLAFQQQIERGGKKQARTSLATATLDAARLRQETQLLDLYKSVELAWIEAVAAQARVALATQRLDVAARLKAETARRVAAARDPAFAEARVGTLHTQARIALAEANATSQAARAILASYWNASGDVEVDARALDAMYIAGGDAAREPVDMALAAAETRAAAARVAVEESRAAIDPTVQVGVRHLGTGNDVALVAGVSVPLAFFDTNAGNIARARAEQRAADADFRAVQIARDRELLQVRARLGAAAAEATLLRDGVIPEADRALRLTREAYERGAFSYVEVIDAERTLTDARERYIAVMKAHHLDAAILNRLTGRYLTETPTQEIR